MIPDNKSGLTHFSDNTDSNFTKEPSIKDVGGFWAIFDTPSLISEFNPDLSKTPSF